MGSQWTPDPERQRKSTMEWIVRRRAEIARRPGTGDLGKAMDREATWFLEVLERRALGQPVPAELENVLTAASATRAAFYPRLHG